MKKLFFLFASLALLATSCKKEEPAPAPKPSTFVSYSADMVLDQYATDNFIWNVSLLDKVAFDNSGVQKGSALDFYVSTTSESDFKAGIPVGTYEIVNDLKNTTMSAIGAYVDLATERPLEITSGSLEVAKENDTYTFTYKVVDRARTTHEGTLSVAVGDEKLFIGNALYHSTLAENTTTDDYTKAFIARRGDQAGLGLGNWDILLGTDGIEFRKDGVISGSGKTAQLWLLTAVGAQTIEGTYTFSETMAAGSAEIGTASVTDANGKLGSWWLEQTGSEVYANSAPLTEGTVTVSKVGENYKIVINAKDDKVPTQNTIVVNYEGPADHYDVDKTGDFYNGSAAYFGPYEHPPLQNWFVVLQNKDLFDSKGVEGTDVAFDMYAPEADSFNSGFPEGTFTIVPTPAEGVDYVVNTITDAKFRRYEEGEDIKDPLAIVSGTIITKKIDFMTVEYKVDAIDANGKALVGTYTGPMPITNASNPPLKDQVFSNEGGLATSGYLGLGVNPGVATWFVDFSDKVFQDTKTDGLVIALDITVDASHTFEKGFPTGTFELYTGAVKEGVINSDNTKYTVMTQTVSQPLAFTGGSVTISNVGEIYTAVFDFVTANDKVSYSITGSYVGLLDMIPPAYSQERLSPLKPASQVAATK